MIKLRADSRSKKFSVARTFGQVTEFPDEFSIKDSQPDFIQQPGDVMCTAITVCDVASDKDSLQYDHLDLFSRINSNEFGAVPQEVIGEGVKNGLLPVGQTQRIKVFNSYYEAHTGGMDAFDSVRSALMVCKYPVAVWTNWYANWNGQTVLPLGENPLSGHMWDAEGFTIKNGEPMLIAEVWLGYKVYLPRETFNKAVKSLGCGTAVLSTLQMDIKTRRNLIEYTIDLCKNAILLLKELLARQSTTPVQNSSPSAVLSPDVPPQPVKTRSERLYDLAYSLIGKHLTLDATVPASLGCAEAMSYLMKEFGYPMPPRGFASTNGFYVWLQNNCKEVTTPNTGDIVIAVSYTGISGARGHVGIWGKEDVMSNDSDTGLWKAHWTKTAFLRYYRDELKLKVKYFRV